MAAAGWPLVAALLALTVLHFTRTDSWWPVLIATAVAPWLFLLAWIVAALSVVTYRGALATIAGVLVVTSLVWLAPEWYPVARATAPARGAVRLRLFDANVQYSNPSLDATASEIRADRPDIVTIEELSSSGLRSLDETGALLRYRWRYVLPLGGAGFGIWSDVPMTGAQTWYAGYHPEVRAWLWPAGAPGVRLYAFHTDAPRSGLEGVWRDELSVLRTMLRRQSGPLVVAGDFNATWDMYEFQDILHAGLKDAAVEEGKGWEMTWSRQARIIPPLVRIDHVLYSSGVTVTGYRTGVGRGSDHRPLIVDLAVTP